MSIGRRFYSQNMTKEGFKVLVHSREKFAELAEWIDGELDFKENLGRMNDYANARTQCLARLEECAMWFSKCLSHYSKHNEGQMENQEQKTP
jgi:hypothetical protein